MLAKNDCIELTIDGVTNEGNGIGRHEGMAVFVPSAAPGDRLQVRIVKVLSNCRYGAIKQVLSPGPGRVAAPDCAVFGRCGGCSLRHLEYAAELVVKNGWVQENLRRIAKLELTLPPAIGSPQPDRYRNKAIYPVQRDPDDTVRLGFYAKRSHHVVEQADCLLHPACFAELAAAFRSWLTRFCISVYDEETHTGLIRSLFLRMAEATGEVMVCIVANGDALPAANELIGALRAAHSGVRSVILNVQRDKTNVLLGPTCHTLWGADTITDRLCGLRFALSPLSFYQVNRQAAERLYAVAAEFADLRKTETLLDLYCGAGTIGLSMAGRVRSLIGVEIIPDAVQNAIENAARNGISNARFLCADAAEAALGLEREGICPDVVVLDPPRKGCEASLLETVARMAPSRVVMVSCDSATAARDVARFGALGYRLVRAQAVDMFPRTAHVESVILLVKLPSEDIK
ncbi:MAG: 23S rRNA (uracil(1939)-C(5))-methyltransferase RlmD [Oscillospiraceae bacterium]